MNNVVDKKILILKTGNTIKGLLEKGKDFLDKPLLNYASQKPKTIEPEALAAKALHVMETHSITCLIVSDPEDRPIGIVQIYYILRAGVY